jgi:spermidine synthase
LGNIVAGIIALVYSRRVARRAGAPTAPEDWPRAALDAVAASPGDGLQPVPGAALTTVALAISGAVSMLYEVGWTRALALAIGSSTYAFTSMLLAFLVGIAGGSALYSRLSPGRRISPVAFALLQAGIGVETGAIILLFERAPKVFLLALRWSAAPEFVQAAQFAVSAGALLFSSLLIGATFPCAVALVAQNRTDIGRQVGRLYGANTLGAIVGSIVAGFILMPMVGTQAMLKGGAAMNLLLASALFASCARAGFRWRWPGAVVCVVVAGGVLLLPHWDQRVMSSGAAIYGRRYVNASRGQDLGQLLGDQRIVYYRDGLSATVAVSQAGEHVYLRVNGKLDAGTAGDMPTQLLSGHLPLLLHAGPKTVLVIGLGSGITAGAVARYPIERLDVVEIEPAVVEASRFFRQLHGGVLEDARVRTVIADGRNFLLTTPERYDVIISEPSNLWIAGMADLFTRDFYETAASKLRPGGIFCQWVQCYQTSPATLRTIFRTLATRFPKGQLFFVDGSADLVILASPDREIGLDLDQLGKWFGDEKVAKNLARVGVSSLPDLMRYYRGRLDRVAREADGGPINTDDNGWLEHKAPFDLLAGTTSEGEMAWSPDVAADLAASITSDRTRAAEVLAEAAARAKAAGNEGATMGLAMAREELMRRPASPR